MITWDLGDEDCSVSPPAGTNISETVIFLIQPHKSIDLPARTPLPFARADRLSQRERIFSLVYRQMFKIAGRSSDIDDLVQSAAEQALRSLDSFDGRAELATWTYRICYFTYLKQRRWYRRWLARFLFWEDTARVEPADLVHDPAQSIDRSEEVSRLWAALARIAPKRRVVVVLHDLEGLDVDQIGDMLCCNPLTVRSRLRDGRKKLALELHSDPYFGPSTRTQVPK
jgi:RNA polymerase sigma factor (sigma-70 family)